MEVHLSKNLRHRNIVKMLDYATRVRKVILISPILSILLIARRGAAFIK